MHHLHSYQLAVQFYRQAKEVNLPAHLRNQLLRAASSVALNLAEGSGKRTVKDRLKYYTIALGSVRECESVMDLSPQTPPDTRAQLDLLARHVFKLCKALE